MQHNTLTGVGFRYLLTIVVVLAVTGIVLAGCNKVQMQEVESLDAFGAPEPPGTGFVRGSCANAPVKSVTKPYNFAKPSITCEWEKNGNLEPRNDYLQARIEDTQTLELEAGAVICDVELSFHEQEFLYDDHFLLAFNNSVIASSFDFSPQLESRHGLLQYDWSKIAGMYWDKDYEGVFCAPTGECDWPVTDTPGVINMKYSSELFMRLMAIDLNRTNHSLKFVSIGDNDEKDCEHSDVSFDLTVRYVVVK